MAKKKKKSSSIKIDEHGCIQHDLSTQQSREHFVAKSFKSARSSLRKVMSDKPTLACEVNKLNEPYYSRRIKAVARYLPQIMEQYGKEHPNVDIESDFADMCAAPILAYDTLDYNSNICLGAALWILDMLKDDFKIGKASAWLPHVSWDDVDAPPIYDPCHSDDVLSSMLYVIQNRYALHPKAYLFKEKSNEGNTSKEFHEILALLPNEIKQRAVKNFTDKCRELADLYYETVASVAEKLDRTNRKCKRLTEEILAWKKTGYSASGAQVANEPRFPFANPSTQTSPLPPMADAYPFSLEARLAEVNALDEEHSQLLREQANIQFTTIRFALLTESEMQENVSEDYAKKLSAFHVDDPFETCFALLYLIDSDDDLPWINSFPLAVTAVAASQLPWGKGEYDVDCDYCWDPDDFDKAAAMVPGKTRVLDDEWYGIKYNNFAFDDETTDRTNLAQLVYQMTGGLLPRNMQRYNPAKHDLRQCGLSPSRLDKSMAAMAVLGEAQRQSVNWAADDFENTDSDQENVPITNTDDTEALQAENASMKKELDRLRRAVHAASKDAQNAHKTIDKMKRESDKQIQELADLRTLVFNQQNDSNTEESEIAKINFPYPTKHKIVVFGGHDSWLREIRHKLPNVRFVDRDILPSADLIRNADVIWIQTNCINHPNFYKITDVVRKYGKQLRYFSYASAVKCAEQIVEQDCKED